MALNLVSNIAPRRAIDPKLEPNSQELLPVLAAVSVVRLECKHDNASISCFLKVEKECFAYIKGSELEPMKCIVLL